jgi:hypothetical protein
MIAMVFFRGFCTQTIRGKEKGKGATTLNNNDNDDTPHRWINKWTELLKYMRQYIPNEPKRHGCMGTNIAAKVQEIIAKHPSTATGHQNAEKEINALLRGFCPPSDG